MSLFGASILRNLYLNPEKSDVCFVIVQDNEQREKIPAHKCILATGSRIFNAIFYNVETHTETFLINDTSAEALQQFLQIFYLDNLQFTFEAMEGVLYLADKFEVDEIFIACSEFLRHNLSVETVCFAYELSVKYIDKMQFLCNLCTEMINVNTAAVFQSSSFLNISKNGLNFLLLRCESSCGPVTLFEACMSWAAKSCEENGIHKTVSRNLRERLADCFYLIPFEEMEMTEFISCFSKYNNLFDVSELEEIMGRIVSKKNSSGRVNTKINPIVQARRRRRGRK